MDRRAHQITSGNIRIAIDTTNVSDTTVAEAAGLTLLEFRSRMNGATDFTVEELGKVGGFLHVRTSSLLEGVA